MPRLYGYRWLGAAQFSWFLVDFLDAMLEVPPLRPGFGLCKRKA